MPKYECSSLILACSPRHGNCDFAAKLVEEALRKNSGTRLLNQDIKVLRLADFKISQCISCGSCQRDPSKGCPLAKSDDSSALFTLLRTVQSIYFVAPIYFYHLPAQLKALIDRSQAHYSLAESAEQSSDASDSFDMKAKREAKVILIAGRPQGENLFTGSLLTLKYFLKNFDVTLAAPMLLRGLDEKDDLKNNREMQESIQSYAQTPATST